MDEEGVVGLGGAGKGLFQNYGTVLGQVYWADLGDALNAQRLGVGFHGALDVAHDLYC